LRRRIRQGLGIFIEVYPPVKHSKIILTSLIFFAGTSLSAAASSLQGFKSKNWGLENKASEIEKAWTLTQGSHNIVVAVIDTGIDANHPDLKANLWRAPDQDGHVSSNSIYGWDFVTKSANPSDFHGHGTHIAGIIGAIANPKTGTAGVNQYVQIMPVRYYSESAPGSVNLANTIKALHYAIEMALGSLTIQVAGLSILKKNFKR
jgi:thermitase